MTYNKEKLEILADQVNEKYFPQRLKEATMLDPFDLSDKLDLNIRYEYLSPNDSILGAISFKDNAILAWPKGNYCKNDRPEWIIARRGDILLNKILSDKCAIEKENFVLAHEIGHWIKDQEYYNNNSENKNDLFFGRECGYREYGKYSNRDIREIQTNYLASAILMPRDILKKAFFDIAKYKTIPKEAIQPRFWMKPHIRELSELYGVNFNPMFYRLNAIGVFCSEQFKK